VKAMVYLPIFHIWDNEEVGFADQFMSSVSVGLRYYTAPRQSETGADGEAVDGAPDTSSQP
jgi:hypothetical protein